MIEPVLTTLPFELIEAGDRARKDYQNVEELAEDIKAHGLYNPLTVRLKPDNTGYLLMAGGRRFMALASLGWEEVPCNLYTDIDDYDAKSIELAENIQREDLSYAERAALVKQIHELEQAKHGQARGASNVEGHSIADTAAIVGMSKTAVRRDLKIANAIDLMPELANCKDASQALKLIDRLEEELIREELSRRADTVLSHEGEDAIKRQLINNFVVGDFFEKVKGLDSRSFHCIEVDTPYAIDLKRIKKEDTGSTNNYDEWSAEEYPAKIEAVIVESKRLLFDDGWLLFWFAMYPWYQVVFDLLSKHGFEIIQPAIWTKNVGQTQWPDRRLASCYEPFFYARKGTAIMFKQGHPNVFTTPPLDPNKKIHPTQKPVLLMQEILEIFAPPSGRICVPFAGSGDTLLAANNLGMSSVGFDLSSQNKDAYTSNVMMGKVGKYA